MRSESVGHSVMSNSLGPYELWPSRLLCPWISPGKNTGVGCHSLLQGIFLTQRSNPGLLHCIQILYHLNQQEALLKYSVGKNPPVNVRRCKRCGFGPWVEKIPWRRKWQPTPVLLPGESHGQRSLAGYSPWGRKRVGHD